MLDLNKTTKRYAPSWRSNEWYASPPPNIPCYGKIPQIPTLYFKENNSTNLDLFLVVRRRKWKRMRRLKFYSEDTPNIPIEEVILKMKGPQGVTLKDRKWHFKTYPRCFIGSEAVEWMMVTYKLTRRQGLMILIEAKSDLISNSNSFFFPFCFSCSIGTKIVE